MTNQMNASGSHSFPSARCGACILALSLLGVITGRDAWAEPADGCPRTAYLSTGDHQDLLWVPLDSAASIDTAFTTLRDRYQVERIWWRGGQDEVWANEFVFRPENRHYDRIWQWWRRLAFEDVGTNRLAVQTAHARGQKIWMAYGLFDNGSAADVGFSGFPYAAEDRMRVEHPEYAPENRWGTWRQGGPIEFAYPEARRRMVDYLAKHTIAGGYDGLAFLTYAENFSQRYEDEFGFSPPIVAEFKKRHGVDIRKQPFDAAALAKLRGEYLTEFFRELHAALAPHGIQIAVCVDGVDPELPARWSHNKARTAGVIGMDVGTWAREGIVDEVNVWAPPDDEAKALARCRELCQGTKTVASAFRTRGQLPPGTPRVMFLGADIESGFDWKNHINYDDEDVPPQPAAALSEGDFYARRRLLTAVLKKKQPALPTADLIKAATDPDLYVRRLALQALAVAGDKDGVPAIRAALKDDEHSVRLQAAVSLVDLAGPDAIGDLFDAISRDPMSYQLRFQALPQALLKLQADGRLTPADKGPVVARLTDAMPEAREAALYALLRIGAPATADVEQALLEILRTDRDPYAREMALANLASSFGPTAAVLTATREAIRDKDDAVQVRALAALAKMLSTAETPADAQTKALAEVTDFFRRYGGDCQRADKEWGWRVAGQALRSFGPEGDKALDAIMGDKADPRLAELAWRVVYVPQGDTFLPSSLADDRAAQAHYPSAKKGN